MGNYYFRHQKAKDIPKDPKKILIFCRKAMGDILMAVPTFRALRHAYPESHIAFWTMEWNRGVVELLEYFNEVVYLENTTVMHQNIWGLIKFIFRMRENKFNIAVLLDSFMFPLYCYLAGIPVRVGYEIDNEGFGLTHKTKISERDYRLDNFLKVATLTSAKTEDKKIQFPIKLDRNDEFQIHNILPHSLIREASLIIALAPGGGHNPGETIMAKNWGIEGFSKVIIKLVAEHNALILLFGRGEKDSAIAEKFMEFIKNEFPLFNFKYIVDLTNKTSLMQVAALLQQCDVTLTNDSALMHLSAVVDTPTVSIFGPTNPENLAPRGFKHRVVKSELACSPCYEEKGYLYCKGECMTGISWERVYNEIKKHLNAKIK